MCNYEIYNSFLLKSIFYDLDNIILFFGENSIICQKIFYPLKNKLDKLSNDNNDILDIISKELESIIFDSKNLSYENNKALRSIFTLFKENSNKNINNAKYYALDILNDKIVYPNNLNKINVDSFYDKNKEYFESLNLDEIINEPNIILNVLSNILSYVSYYKNGNGIGDISFYDKLKINTALSSCLFLLKTNNVYENFFLKEEKYFALLSADISGIQKFIYTISSKGALKSLRARSFYLEIMLEHIVDEILEYFKLKRSNLLYTGGGHFYILIPNYKDLKDNVAFIRDKINDWFIKEFSVDLYIAMDYMDFSFNDFRNTKNIFRGLSKKLSLHKQNRYNKKQLNNLLFPKENESDFECSICNTSSKSTIKRNNDFGYVCDICYNLYKAGKYVINKNDNITIVNTKNNFDTRKIIDLPSLLENRYLYFGNIDSKDNSVVRIYSKNNNSDKHISLYLGDYNYKSKNNIGDDLSSFDELIEGTNGIRRIGVLRCDVDNLGQAFINGFKDHSDIFRTSALSRHLSLFFKYYINFICEGDTQFDNKKLFGDKYFNKEKHVVIVYSGGDDVFLVGYWLDVINFAFDLREAFRIYTEDKLTFSAGIGFFHSSYPISKMASQTGELEDLAKNHIYNNQEKDSIALFGISHSKEDYFKYCFNWKEFDKVHDKIKLIFDTCYFDESSISEDKIFFSSSFMYRLKQLMYKEALENDKINIARFAYSISRIKSKGSEKYIENYEKFKTNMYNWFLDSNDRKYLNTALDLIIYLNRVDSNNQNESI